jgi:cell division protein ZapA (FtsZ GTPase activity inhibitor)
VNRSSTFEKMQSLKVRILGEEYAFRVANPVLTQKAIEQVNQLIAEYRQKTSEYSTTRLAVLSATNLSERNIELEEKILALTAEIKRLNEFIAAAFETHDQINRLQPQDSQAS